MTDRLKILMLSAEMVPFAKVGGLADVTGALPKALHALGHDVRVAMPRYGRIDPAQFNLQRALDPFPVPLDGMSDHAAILEGKLDADIPAYFVENKRLFERDGIYMYQDDAERFIFFARAALEMLRRLDWAPDIIHCHDWHTALIPNWLRTIYATDRFFANTATVYTIHNIAYQGIFGHRILEISGLSSYGFIAHPSVAPDLHQLIDFMARGISFADQITTVSETYATEIQTPAYGEKLDPFLRDRRKNLTGILNGLDTTEYDPATDAHLAQTFDARNLDARRANKVALQRELGLPQDDVPMLGMTSRLIAQKGMDLVTSAIDHVLENSTLQFVVMGAGDQTYHDFFARLRDQNPTRVAYVSNYNPVFARKIYGGADMLLMPSRTEPCGNDQMLAMRYGCIPIVHATGGLADTVQDFDAANNTGTGFVFKAFDRWAMFAAIVRALQVYASPEQWRGLQARALARDFSWDTAGKKYEQVYRRALEIHQRTAQVAHALAEDMDHTAATLAALPPRLARLGELAYNLWWGWNPAGRHVFEELDPGLWEEVYRNPVRLLREIDPARLIAASKDAAYLEKFDAALAQFDAYMNQPTTWFATTYPYENDHSIAYFSAEFGLHQCLPIYSGGLGILSGDHIKEASDLGLPFVGIGFLYPQGYFTQKLNPDGWQEAIYEKLNFALVPAMPAKNKDGRDVMVEVELPGRSVYAKVWRIQVGRVPLFLMDTDVDVNAPADRELAARLYGGDNETRIVQEYVLGVGGVRVLRALGYQPSVYHLNEGHSSFSIIERLREFVQQGLSFAQASARVRATTVFTTHTPVAAGHDAFSPELMQKYFGGMTKQIGLSRDELFNLANQHGTFSMTVLALRFAGAANGVSQLHGEVSRKMWQWLYPGKSEKEVPIGAVTNGVHTLTWLAPEYHDLFDGFFPRDWREHLDDPAVWQAMDQIPDERLWQIHYALKQKMFDLVLARTGVKLNPNVLTFGFARRFATYKRAVLMFRDAERLKRILNNPGRPAQIVFSGKAHPADNPGKEFIRAIVQLSRQPGFAGRIVFVPDYDIKVARHLVQGVDVWLNNPRRPLEASGTSGEKASVNGAPNFSVLDGWWREGYIANANGWSIGEDRAWDDVDAQDAADAESFYATLENQVVPLYYTHDATQVPHDWVRWMKNAIKTIAPQYSTKRMIKEYTTKYYAPLGSR